MLTVRMSFKLYIYVHMCVYMYIHKSCILLNMYCTCSKYVLRCVCMWHCHVQPPLVVVIAIKTAAVS